jgi:DNA-binding NarL/FixJ family response regulator
MKPIRVMCIDDSPIVAEALGRCISREQGLQWDGWVDDAARLYTRLNTDAPDVLLVDIDMPGIDSFALVAEVKERRPLVRVAMLTGHVRAEYLDRAFVAGANGYISKDDAVTLILDHIRRLAAGDFVLSPGV